MANFPVTRPPPSADLPGAAQISRPGNTSGSSLASSWPSSSKDDGPFSHPSDLAEGPEADMRALILFSTYIPEAAGGLALPPNTYNPMGRLLAASFPPESGIRTELAAHDLSSGIQAYCPNSSLLAFRDFPPLRSIFDSSGGGARPLRLSWWILDLLWRPRNIK